MNFYSLLASGFGVGYAPKAPGTFGSLVGLLFGALLLNSGHVPLFLGIVLVAAVGVYIVGKLDSATQDPGWIVIDEIAGQMLPLLALSHLGFAGFALSFALFRLFDIWKPGPVGWANARHDEYGVMGDDIIAGLLALVVMLLLRLVIQL
ncbi:MAG TPA: phosphatidylglycerophosphatase A [Acidocella sp.]|nr:phosphatidylglycerophosphatase A [Acidocella sp.]